MSIGNNDTWTGPEDDYPLASSPRTVVKDVGGTPTRHTQVNDVCVAGCEGCEIDRAAAEGEKPQPRKETYPSLVDVLVRSGLTGSRRGSREFISAGAIFVNDVAQPEDRPILESDFIDGFVNLRLGKFSKASLNHHAVMSAAPMTAAADSPAPSTAEQTMDIDLSPLGENELTMIVREARSSLQIWRPLAGCGFHTDAARSLRMATEILTLRSQLSTVTRERDAAVKVIERLPKTADGVPITFGMEVWADDPDGGSFTPPVSGLVDGIYAKNFDEYKGECTIGFGENEAGNGDVYSTRDAALSGENPQPRKENDTEVVDGSTAVTGKTSLPLAQGLSVTGPGSTPDSVLSFDSPSTAEQVKELRTRAKLRKSQGFHSEALELDSVAATIERLEKRMKLCCADWAEDHTRLQELFRPFGIDVGETKEHVDIQEMAEQIANALSTVTRERDAAVNELQRVARSCHCNSPSCIAVQAREFLANGVVR